MNKWIVNYIKHGYYIYDGGASASGLFFHICIFLDENYELNFKLFSGDSTLTTFIYKLCEKANFKIDQTKIIDYKFKSQLTILNKKLDKLYILQERKVNQCLYLIATILLYIFDSSDKYSNLERVQQNNIKNVLQYKCECCDKSAYYECENNTMNENSLFFIQETNNEIYLKYTQSINCARFGLKNDHFKYLYRGIIKYQLDKKYELNKKITATHQLYVELCDHFESTMKKKYEKIMIQTQNEYQGVVELVDQKEEIIKKKIQDEIEEQDEKHQEIIDLINQTKSEMNQKINYMKKIVFLQFIIIMICIINYL